MDAPSAGVLRDLAILAWMALLVGALAYGWLRTTRPALAWNWGGQVNARPYNALDAVVVTVVSLFLLGMTKRVPEIAAKAETPQLSVEPLLVNVVVLLIACGLLLAYLLGIQGRHPVELFGLRRLGFFRAAGVALVYMFPVWIIVALVANGTAEWMNHFWPNQDPQELVEAFRGSSDTGAKAMMVLSAVIVAPLVEETIFRGFLYGVIKRYTDSYFAAICSSLLFAVVHLHVGSFFPLVVLACAFCLAYELTGSLLVTMCMHAIFNGTSLVFMVFGK